METRLLLKNGRIVDNMLGIDKVADMLISDGVIVDIGSISLDVKTIDCTGLVIIPGICDMHVHLREPGYTEKEDIITGANAAAAGGVTAVLAMPNTSPPVDNPEIIEKIIARGKESKVKVYTACTLTKGMKGEELCDFEILKAAGAVAATDDGLPVKDSRLMMEAMEKAHYAGLRVISHCEDLGLTNGGIINEGKVSKALGVKGVTRASENICTLRELALAETLNIPIHIAHVSTKEAVRAINTACSRGVLVTCETAPHYFTLTEDELLKRDADYRMAPPLREEIDRGTIEGALINGIIDCIITDHAPHTEKEKTDFIKAPNGVVGLETSLAVTLTQLYHTGKLTLDKIVKLMCVNPRRILGIKGGSIGVGDIADIAIFDPNEEWTVKKENLHSKSKNTCFKDMKLKGKVKYTIVSGELVFSDNQNV